jgi:hypothetical protein
MASPWGVTATKAKGQGDGEAREIPEPGSQPAVVVALVDLGTHPRKYEDSGKTVNSRRVYVAWELTDAPVSGTKGRNHVLCRDYTVAFSDKAGLRKMTEALGKKFAEGEAFDLLKLLGRRCLVTVDVKESAAGHRYAKIVNVTAPPKGFTVPEPKLTPFSWQLGDGDENLPPWLPWLMGRPVTEWLAECQERKGRGQASPAQAEAVRAAADAVRRGPTVAEVQAAAATAETPVDEIPW